jgi:hypothetical protein
MAAPDLHDSAPPGVAPGAIARLDALCFHMPRIAEAVQAFTDPTLRERAYYELVSILNPSEPDTQEPASPTVAEANARRALDQLESWLHINLPDDAARINDTPNNTAVDVAINLLREFRQSLLTPQEKVDDRERGGR